MARSDPRLRWRPPAASACVAPARAAAVLEQAALRRRAVAKLGPRAAALFTARGRPRTGRTRAPVAACARARRFADAGVGVVDLGCGIGADALATPTGNRHGRERDPP